MALIEGSREAVVTVTEIYSIFASTGFPGIVFLIAWGGFTRRWVWGWTYIELLGRLSAMEKERDEWKNLSITLMRSTRHAVEVARDVTKALPTGSSSNELAN